ncbi:MAG: LPS assembly protein LptD [Alphaproteobacteria bacterium]
MDKSSLRAKRSGARQSRKLLSLGCWLSWIASSLALLAMTENGAMAVPAAAAAAAPLLVKANQTTYASSLDKIVASGNVLVYHNDRTLLANEVVFERHQGTIEADCEGWMRTLSGDLIWAQHVTLEEDLDKGKLTQLRILMADNSRFAAVEGLYHHEDTDLWGAVYSPCRVCQNAEAVTPLWQIKADQVTHNKQDEVLVYKNARLEIMGVPVIYTPYFRHPDPTVKRKTGLLVPVFSTSKDLGFIFGQPIYAVISDDSDTTITPILTSKQGPIIIGEYRKRFRNSMWLLHGSYTQTHNLPNFAGSTLPSPTPNRWHAIAKGRAELTDDHLLTMDLNRASDTTYLRRYPVLPQKSFLIPKDKNLTSTVRLEQFLEKSYASAAFYSFQTDNKPITPLVAPLADYHYRSTPGLYGETFETTFNFLSLTRQLDIPGKFPKDSQRVSTSVGGQVPYISPWGDEWKGEMWLRGDAYRLNHFRKHSMIAPHLHTEGRLFPQGALRWRYPFISYTSTSSWLVEPEAMFISSPTMGNKQRFPNEDADNVELDYTNLFKLNRFSGLDRLDCGNRLVYGLNNSWQFPSARRIVLFLGRTSRLDHQQVLPPGVGEDAHGSDIITRLKVEPAEWLNLRHQSRLQHKDMHPRVAETYVIVGNRKLRLQTGHIYISPQPTLNINQINQVNWQISTQAISQWTIAFAESRNVRGGVLARLLTFSYQNECLQMDIGAYQTAYQDRDIRPDVGMLFKLTFKNLGTFSPLASPNSPSDIFNSFFS